MWGSEDRVIPLDCGQQYAELLPDARLEMVDAGHIVDLENPARLAELVTDHARRAEARAGVTGSAAPVG